MSFLKGVLKVLNPLPSIVKANKEAGSIGGVLKNLINPAGAIIRDNTGELDLKLSQAYKDMLAFEADLASREAEIAKQQLGQIQQQGQQQKPDNTMIIVIAAVAVGALLLFKK